MTSRKATSVLLFFFAVLVGSQIFKAIVNNAVPGMSGLDTLGWNVDASAALFTAAIILTIEGDRKRMLLCLEAIVLLGLLGTALGFSGYLHEADATLRREHLKVVFLSTAQGLVHAISVILLHAVVGRLREPHPATRVVPEWEDES